jgi:ATP-dependent RNA helicase DDX10/DBP4
VYDAKREKVSEIARAQEMEATTSTYGGINLEEAKKAMQEEDKFDKEIFRQRIKAKHREERLKAKAERRQQSNQEEVDDQEEEGGDSESEGSLDGSVASIIDALPDPDRIYGARDDDDDDDDMDFKRGPAPPKY